MKKKINLSLNCSKIIRKRKEIKYVVIHYTGMQSEIESIKRLRDKKSKVSCHYLINRSGLIFKMVNENQIAWHAGKSKWKKFNNLNKYSIGIELVNKGHKIGYQNYSHPQIKTLIKLSSYLKKKYKIKTENFLGHSDIAPLRKIDPGEKFPWKKLSKFKIGYWFSENNKNLKTYKSQDVYSQFFRNLHKIGYRYFSVKFRSKSDKFIIKAFQRKFCPKNVDGKIDKKTFKISQLLIK